MKKGRRSKREGRRRKPRENGYVPSGLSAHPKQASAPFFHRRPHARRAAWLPLPPTRPSPRNVPAAAALREGKRHGSEKRPLHFFGAKSVLARLEECARYATGGSICAAAAAACARLSPCPCHCRRRRRRRRGRRRKGARRRDSSAHARCGWWVTAGTRKKVAGRGHHLDLTQHRRHCNGAALPEARHLRLAAATTGRDHCQRAAASGSAARTAGSSRHGGLLRVRKLTLSRHGAACVCSVCVCVCMCSV